MDAGQQHHQQKFPCSQGARKPMTEPGEVEPGSQVTIIAG